MFSFFYQNEKGPEEDLKMLLQVVYYFEGESDQKLSAELYNEISVRPYLINANLTLRPGFKITGYEFNEEIDKKYFQYLCRLKKEVLRSLSLEAGREYSASYLNTNLN